jgi:hypothetical protein
MVLRRSRFGADSGPDPGGNVLLIFILASSTAGSGALGRPRYGPQLVPPTVMSRGPEQKTQTSSTIIRKRCFAFNRRFPAAGSPSTTQFPWVRAGFFDDPGSEEYPFVCHSSMCLFVWRLNSGPRFDPGSAVSRPNYTQGPWDRPGEGLSSIWMQFSYWQVKQQVCILAFVDLSRTVS